MEYFISTVQVYSILMNCLLCLHFPGLPTSFHAICGLRSGYALKDGERIRSAAKLALEARFGREHRLFAIDSEQDGV